MISLAVLAEPFADRLARDGQTLERRRLEVLQVNVGKLCNQTCTHGRMDLKDPEAPPRAGVGGSSTSGSNR